MAASAARTPGAPAVRDGTTVVTYRELDRAAEALAAVLAERGLAPDTPVAVLLERGPALLVALLAVQKAGLAYLPLEPAQPDARLAALLALAPPALAITRDALRARLPATLPWLAADAADAAPVPATRRAAARGTLAYIKFTSGSGGRPKPVAVSHANLAGLFAGITPALGLDATDTWSWGHSPAFGYSAWEIWGALTHGACLAVVPEAARADPAALAAFLADAGVTVFSQTPSAFRLALASDAFHAGVAAAPLRWVALSGEPLRDADVTAWFARHPQGPPLAASYAITETAGQLTLRLFRPADAAAPAADRAGPPLPGRALRVAGADGAPLPPGLTGEVWASGDCLARYLLAGDGTGRYVDDPADGRRWYRTGDRGEWTAGGELLLRGRADLQLKFRGVRIEPAEVEAVLRRQPGVRDAAVVLHDPGDAPARLTAYVVPDAAVPDVASPAGPAFWPSLGAWGVYDEFLYGLMDIEPRRLAAFRAVLARVAPGRVALDLGTGADALLARLAVAAGARHVYAVELLAPAAAAATALVASLGLADRITVLAGDIADLALPEPVDLCLQGIVGNIGSADGIVGAWRAARRHFAPGCQPLPDRCVTRIAPVTLPAALRAAPRFAAPALRYVRELAAGGREDLRLCVHGVGRDALRAAPATFEDLDFRGELPDGYTGSATFTVTGDGPVDGFLLWTEVAVAADAVVDYLDAQQGWLPVFLPLPAGPVPLAAGARLALRWRCEYASHPQFPDYVVDVATEAGELRLVSRHGPDPAGVTALHRQLCAALPASDGPAIGALRAALAAALPAASVPQAWVFLPALPLNTNGKLDRAALPAPGTGRPPLAVPFAPPADATERRLATVWESVLGLTGLGRDDDFFDLGGDSILAVQLVTAVARGLDTVVPLAALFDAPTIAGMARALAAAPAPGAGARDRGEL